MVKIVLGVAIALMLATAFFGFQTKGNITGLKDNLKTTTDNLQATKGTLEKTKTDLKAKEEEANVAKKAAEDAAAEAAAAKADAQAKAAAATDLQNELAAAKAALEAAGKNKSTTEAATGGPSADELTKLQEELKVAQTKLAEAQQINVSLESKSKAAQATASDLQQKEQRRQQGLLKPGLEGQVLAVNSGWNFVVLSLGDHQGAVMNAEMLVVRGDTRIAKVRITSVEPSTSVADVVPGSQARGAHIQPGDRVIFPGAQ